MVEDAINLRSPDFWMTEEDVYPPGYSSSTGYAELSAMRIARYPGSVAKLVGLTLEEYLTALDEAMTLVSLSDWEVANAQGSYFFNLGPSARVTTWTNQDAFRPEIRYDHLPPDLRRLANQQFGVLTKEQLQAVGVSLSTTGFWTTGRRNDSTTTMDANGVEVITVNGSRRWVPYKRGTATAEDIERTQQWVDRGAYPNAPTTPTTGTPVADLKGSDIAALAALGINPEAVSWEGLPNLQYDANGQVIPPNVYLVSRGINSVGEKADHMFVVLAYGPGQPPVRIFSFAPSAPVGGKLVSHSADRESRTTIDDLAAWASLSGFVLKDKSLVVGQVSMVPIQADPRVAMAVGTRMEGYLGTSSNPGPVNYELVPNLVPGRGANSNSAAYGIAQASRLFPMTRLQPGTPVPPLKNQPLPPKPSRSGGAPGFGQWRIALGFGA